MQRYLFMIDRFSAWSGKAIAWIIVVSTVLITYDVTMRYLSKPFGDVIRSMHKAQVASAPLSRRQTRIAPQPPR